MSVGYNAHINKLVPRQSVYRHFVYYCIPAYMTYIHPTSVSANHYFHQFHLLLEPYTMIPFYQSHFHGHYDNTTYIASKHCGMKSSMFFQLTTLIFINSTSSLEEFLALILVQFVVKSNYTTLYFYWKEDID